MLSSLKIKNLALIDEITLEMGKGLNILSGETGAGKSIIIGSLNFVLGDRANKTLIRHGEDYAMVEVVFEVDKNPEVNQFFEEYGIEQDEYIIVNRKMNVAGKSECRVNGHFVNISVLKKLIPLLIDIYSQGEQLTLSKESNHIKILDNSNDDLGKILVGYQKNYNDYKAVVRMLSEIGNNEERSRKIDILSFQIEEIEKADIYDGEEADLISERKKLLNHQKIIEGITNSLNALESDDGYGASENISSAQKILMHIADFDEAYDVLSSRLESVKIELKDIIDTLKSSIDYNIDRDRLAFIEQRIEQIRTLKRKYGASYEQILLFLSSSKKELETLLNSDREVEELELKKLNLETKLISQAKELTKQRELAARVLEERIKQNLFDLEMKNTKFVIDITSLDCEDASSFTSSGKDCVQFLISPNPGQPLYPLSKIASGGEMSRFMLALKSIIADCENIDTLVFDEIDTGISGNVAKTVAEKMYNIARSRQVIAVTHLPQIAVMADNHFLINKYIKDMNTLTEVMPLDYENSLKEVIRLTGANIESKIALLNAKEMKEWANTYKKNIDSI